MSTTQFSPWQLVTVLDYKGMMREFIVYYDSRSESSLEKESNLYQNRYHVGDTRERRLTEVEIHLHGASTYLEHSLSNLCIGCSECTNWNCCECDNPENNSPTPSRVHCIHAKALVQFLKNYEVQSSKPDFEVYGGEWVNEFKVTRKSFGQLLHNRPKT